jgi:hypothetical protein
MCCKLLIPSLMEERWELKEGLRYTVPGRPQVVDSKDGEMSEWLKEHAWKLTPAARADAHEITPTQC